MANNFSDLIKMSLNNYNRSTVENAAGSALIDKTITQHQYDYLMTVLDERELIMRKNPDDSGIVPSMPRIPGSPISWRDVPRPALYSMGIIVVLTAFDWWSKR